jgi:hypothetical protein
MVQLDVALETKGLRMLLRLIQTANVLFFIVLYFWKYRQNEAKYFCYS